LDDAQGKMYCPSCGGDNYRLRSSDKTVAGFLRYQCRERNCRRRFTANTAARVALEKEPKPAEVITSEQRLVNEIKLLRKQVLNLSQEAMSTRKLRELIHGLDSAEAKPPRWTVEPKAKGTLGTPTLFLSDLHWGEVVRKREVNGCNEFNLGIASTRLKRIIETSVVLCRNYLHGDYPGIVLPLGGDMVSGNIHDEIRETNQEPILEITLDLFEHLVAAITLLAGDFGHVFVPCVVGNHGRLDRKPRAKGAVRDNYEWILYQFLARHFSTDDRVTVAVSDSLDYIYRVHNHRYLLTHGDQFKGGSGISGPMTPWALGDHRKRKRQDAINQPYDTMIFGHWHQLFWGAGNFICNGSLKGYDEYAYRSNFPFQEPMQAMWITHPDKGITHQMPLLAEDKAGAMRTEWVSIAA